MSLREGAPGAVEARDVRLAVATPAGPRTVLAGVDLRVDAGELVAIAGRSGSGKTTLLLVVAGLQAPDHGDVHVLGAPAATAHAWHDVALVPQSLGLLEELTVEENVLLPARLSGAAPGAAPDPLLERLGLGRLRGRFPSEISLGEQQRTALARAVLGRPAVVLADEPISHQNHEWATVMMEVLADQAAAGTACLLATHNEVAFAFSHRVLELRGGQVEPR